LIDRNADMAGRQAKILTDQQIENLLAYASATRNPDRNRVIVLLSMKAGLRAGEIANLTWDMVLDSTGEIGLVIELRDRVAKKNSGRLIPLHSELRIALSTWRSLSEGVGAVIQSERGGHMTPVSIVNWFATAIAQLGLTGARLIRDAAHSSRARRGSRIKLGHRCAMFSCWLAIGRSKRRNATLTAIQTHNASSSR
jgi:integrase